MMTNLIRTTGNVALVLMMVGGCIADDPRPADPAGAPSPQDVDVIAESPANAITADEPAIAPTTEELAVEATPMGGAVTGGLTAAAATHRNANLYAFWAFSGCCYTNLDQYYHVAAKAHHTFWATNWTWAFMNIGGYMGLQTDGNRFDHTVGDTAIFSLWNANGARGGSCNTFDSEGSGYSCRRAFTIRTDRFYRLRVRRLERDLAGQWWGAWVLDAKTGTDYKIGDIRVGPADDGRVQFIQTVNNFSEYFGGSVSCDNVPVSWTAFAAPQGNLQASGKYEFGSLFNGGRRAACTGGEVALVNPYTTPQGATHAASIVMGGKR